MHHRGDERDFWTGFRRGLSGKCPSCGEAKLYSSYLKVVPTCTHCGHALGEYRSDDGPAYFTILEAVRTLPLALVTGGLIAGLVVVTLWLLPIVKGAFVGAQWALRDDGGP